MMSGLDFRIGKYVQETAIESVHEVPPGIDVVDSVGRDHDIRCGTDAENP